MNAITNPNRSPGSWPRSALRPGTLLVGLSAFLLACDKPEEPPRSPEPAPRVEPRQAEPLPGVLYRTELTFVGRGGRPSLLHLRLDNRTDSAAVRLHYRGWFGGDEWRQILDQVDSLPVPRAAWRVLPTGPVRVMAGEGGEPSSIIVKLSEGTLRLDSRGAIASWNSSAGRRESLWLAELLAESGAEAGLLIARQEGRRLDDPPVDDTGQYFLVTDTTGNGLLVMRDSTSPDSPVTAWTWVDDTESEWTDALILALAASGDSPGRWSFELPEAGLLGELRGAAPGVVDAPEGEAGVEMFRVEANLVFAGESWTMRGIGVQGRTRE